MILNFVHLSFEWTLRTGKYLIHTLPTYLYLLFYNLFMSIHHIFHISVYFCAFVLLLLSVLTVHFSKDFKSFRLWTLSITIFQLHTPAWVSHCFITNYQGSHLNWKLEKMGEHFTARLFWSGCKIRGLLPKILKDSKNFELFLLPAKWKK